MGSSFLAAGGGILGLGGFGLALGSVTALISSIDLRLKSDRGEVVLKDALLLGTDLAQDLGLVDDGLLGLLGGTLNAAVHPVLVVAGWLNVHVVKLLLNVFPDLTVLEVGIQLNHLHVLLLDGVQLVEIKTNTEESCENASTDVVGLNEAFE